MFLPITGLLIIVSAAQNRLKSHTHIDFQRMWPLKLATVKLST